MRRIVLFSKPIPGNIDKILGQIFPKDIENKVFAYMPSDGSNIVQKYVNEWKYFAETYNAVFSLINNSLLGFSKENIKLSNSNILVISGGNTFKLLENLRKSELDKTIKEFTRKDEFVLSGFSAGAIVLSPTIEICNLPGFDENLIELKDLTGLGIVDFEVFPHYQQSTQKDLLNKYRSTTKLQVREITDDGSITIDL